MTSSNRASDIRLGSYQLAERIGEGGSAHVHRAVADDGREVAIKLLSPSAELDDDSARARFEREIRVLAELRHPGVLELLDSGIDDELGPYLVTELVPGRTLRKVLEQGALGPDAAALLLEPLVGGLAAVHRAGLVHRDVKPENVIVTPEGRVVLVDLGLAYRAGQTRYTEQGSVVGSVPYMAPEQVEGREVSAASDVWALVVMLYEAIAGRRPFQRERTPEEAAAILVGTFEPLDQLDHRVSPALSQLVSACLVHGADARPSATDVGAVLEQALAWIEPAARAAERAAVLSAPRDYAERVAETRAAALAEEARAQLAAGQAFVALRTIDRGLAYRADDPALRALAERAEAAPATAAPARRRWIAPLVAAVVVAGLGAIIAVNVMGTDDPPAPAATAPGPLFEITKAPGSDDTMELARGVLDVFSRSLALGEEESRRESLARANGTTVPAATAIELPPLPLDQLPESGPARLHDLAVAPGQPLVPPSLLGGADPAATIADFDRRAAASPGDLDWAIGRVLVYLAAGRTERGLELLDELEAAQPEAAKVLAARGFVEMRRGRYAEAERALDRSLELQPEDAEARRNRGILRSRLGRTRAAYGDLVEAIRLSPGDGEALRELAGIYSAAGRPTDARTVLGYIQAR